MKVLSLIQKLRGKNPASARRTDPDERWSNLYREREKNNIYKWVGMRTGGGGELISVYEKEGEDGVLSFAQEKVESMLFNEGQSPQVVKFADYLRWKKSMNVILGITEEEEISEANSYFREHEAQTRLNKRGVEGETLVHLLLNRKEPVCREIARILINRYPGLAKDIYLGEEMFGQSGLHLAIVHNDYEMVQLLLENGASVHARATGEFFMPEDYEKCDLKTMDYKGYAYYGQYPLAFAACFENKDIYDLLIQHGANPDMQDLFGNTVLHMCVIYNKNAMYSYSVRHWHKPAHSHIMNNAGQTPLTLATRLGRRQIFDEMLELMKVEFWRFSDMTCSAYPLDALDTISADGTTNFESALMTVVNGDELEHLDMIGSEVIQRLLADKWNAFAKRKLFERLGLLLLQLFNLSFVVYLRPADADRLYMRSPLWIDWVRTFFEGITVINCLYFLFVQQLSDVRNQGFYAYYQNIKAAPAKVTYILGNTLFLPCIVARVMQNNELEDTLLSFAIPCSWTFILFFLGGTKVVGPFVQIIYNMMSRDIVRYTIIASIFLIPFSMAFYSLAHDAQAMQALTANTTNPCDSKDPTIHYYDNLFDTFMRLYGLMIQASAMSYDEYTCMNYVDLSRLLLVIYVVIIPIMMMNILIAMMENTYIEIIEHAEKAWRQQYAKIILVLERSLTPKKLAEAQLEYSIRMNEPGRENRGLMVIKQTKKTKARQRKQALVNWKLIGRKVISMAKELGTKTTGYLLHSIDQLSDDSWKSLVRPQTSARSSLKSGKGGDEGGDERTPRSQWGQVEILQIEFGQHIGGLFCLIDLLQHNVHISFQNVVQNATNLNARLKYAEMRRQMLVNGIGLHPRLATLSSVRVREWNERLSAGDIELRIPEHQFLHLTQRQLIAQNDTRVRGVEMLPSVDVPNIPAMECVQQTGDGNSAAQAWKRVEGNVRVEKEGLEEQEGGGSAWTRQKSPLRRRANAGRNRERSPSISTISSSSRTSSARREWNE